MLKWVMMVCVLGGTIFSNFAEAQTCRGCGRTRSERNRVDENSRYPGQPMIIVTPPIVSQPPIVIQQQSPAASIIADAANGLIRGCEVRLRVDGWANQIYLNGTFAGNFQDGRDDAQLAYTLNNYLYQGQCRYRTGYELDLIRNAYLIDDFAQGYSHRCFVKIRVDGWANQLYLDGQFSGNFSAGTEDLKLRTVLVDLITSGRCDYQRY